MERHSFRIVLGESPETMRKLCLSTKFSLPIYGNISLGNIYWKKQMGLRRIVNDHVKLMCFPKQAISVTKGTSLYQQ